MTIEERLKKIRKDKGLSQKEMADRLKVTTAALSGWETGRVPAGKARLYVIAEEFGVNNKWLLTGEGPQYRSEMDVDNETRRKIEDETLLKLFLSLPLDTQERILEVLRENVKKQGGTINGNINQE